MAAMINESGGVMGRPIEILARDDESTPAVGVSRANELISAGVSVIIEGWNSPVTLAMQPVINRAGVLDITAISKADPILSGEGNPLAVRLNSSNSQDGAWSHTYRQQGKAHRLPTQNDAYGNGAQASIENELKKLSYTYDEDGRGEVPVHAGGFPRRADQCTGRQSRRDRRHQRERRPGHAGAHPPGAAERSRPAGDGGRTIAPSVIQVAGEAANGIVGADIYFPDVEPFASNRPTRIRRRDPGDVRTTPDKYMALGATALQVWAMAANESKSLDKEAIAKRIRGGSFKGTIFGEVTFGPTDSSGRATSCSQSRTRRSSSGGDRRAAGRGPVLSVEGLGVRYGALVALDDVTWEVSAGEILGIIGPNGAGKSSCYDAVTNMVRRRGQVFLRGEDVTDAPPHASPSAA